MTCRKIFLLFCVLIISAYCRTYASGACELLEQKDVLSPAMRIYEQGVQKAFSETADDKRFDIMTGGKLCLIALKIFIRTS